MKTDIKSNCNQKHKRNKPSSNKCKYMLVELAHRLPYVGVYYVGGVVYVCVCDFSCKCRMSLFWLWLWLWLLLGVVFCGRKAFKCRTLMQSRLDLQMALLLLPLLLVLLLLLLLDQLYSLSNKIEKYPVNIYVDMCTQMFCGQSKLNLSEANFVGI